MGGDPYAIFFEGKAVNGVRTLLGAAFDGAIFIGHIAC